MYFLAFFQYFLDIIKVFDIFRFISKLFQNVCSAHKSCLGCKVTIRRQSIQITVEIACFNITLHCTVCIRCIRLYQIIDWIELSSLSIFTNIGHQKYHIQFFTARKHQVRLVVISTPFNNLKFYFCIYLFSDDLIHFILYGLHICR